MNENKRVSIILVAMAIIIGFFLPWIKFFVNVSGWDIVFGSFRRYIGTTYKYIILLIPLSACVTLFLQFKDHRYSYTKEILLWTPIAVILLMMVIIAIEIIKRDSNFRVSDFETFIKTIGFGFWISFLGSLALPFQQNNFMIKKVNCNKVSVS